MTNQAESSNGKIYDLEERTARFGEDIIKFCSRLPNTAVNRPLISQLVRSGTSIGANYMEADAADSKKDFRYKISLCKKEAKETMQWLRMISSANEIHNVNCRQFWKEVHELVLIFSRILITSKGKK